MAQSIIGIYKLLGQQAVKRYFVEGLEPEFVVRLLESEAVGPTLIYKSVHFDPTTTAVIDMIQHRFPRLVEGHRIRRFKSEDFDVLTVVLSATELPGVIAGMRYTETNIDELNLLFALVKMAVSFWGELPVTHGIDSILIITVQTLGPSLLDDDVVKAAYE